MIPPLEIWHARHIALARAAAREREPVIDDEETRERAPGAPSRPANSSGEDHRDLVAPRETVKGNS
ncbi:hypothetical protein ACPW96_03885 [Micromonospora sp. DT81.3]|uniref:hypothetical protein n=1 Tax=Micromonospora sp. DT81.3 TaxID=3416523 RepID=UPI003CF43E0D